VQILSSDETLTLVDAARMVVERTVALTRRSGLLGQWLPAPRVAEAKVLGAGVAREAVFGPDGQHLYVFGWATDLDANDLVVYRGLGVQHVDVARGAIVAEALLGEQAKHVLPAPDGRSLYVLGPRGPVTPFIAPGPYWLRRLDAHTLAVLAERDFDAYRVPWVRPAAQDPW